MTSPSQSRRAYAHDVRSRKQGASTAAARMQHRLANMTTPSLTHTHTRQELEYDDKLTLMDDPDIEGGQTWRPMRVAMGDAVLAYSGQTSAGAARRGGGRGAGGGAVHCGRRARPVVG